MFWGELLAKLDAVRSKIRQIPNFTRTLVPAEHEVLSALMEITVAASKVEEMRTVSLEIGPDGKPIIPAELRDIFAIAPAEEEAAPAVESSTRRIDHKTNITPKTAKGKEMTVSMLPREDVHVNRPPDLTEANESTVVK